MSTQYPSMQSNFTCVELETNHDFIVFKIRYNRELSVWVTMLTQILDNVCQIKKMPSHNMVFATENRLREEFYYVTQWLSLSVDFTSV